MEEWDVWMDERMDEWDGRMDGWDGLMLSWMDDK